MASPPTTPPGGQSNIRGILYQFLLSVQMALNSKISGYLDLENGNLTGTTLIFEPPTDVDFIQDRRTFRIVKQYKTRSGGGTWAFKEVIEDVLPNLYKAVELGKPTRYEFETDGRKGEWGNATNLLESIEQAGNYAALDDNKVYDLGIRPNQTGKGYHHPASVTAKKFVDAVTDYFQRKGVVLASDTLDVTRAKVIALLGAFDPTFGSSLEVADHETELALRQFTSGPSGAREKRDQLIQKLMALVASGECTFTDEGFSDLFEELGLPRKPITNMTWLREMCRQQVQSTSVVLNYNRARDIYPSPILPPTACFPSGAPALILAGEPMMGKTWRTCRLALELQESLPLLCILVESSGTAAADIQTAATVLWNRVFGLSGSTTPHEAFQKLRAHYPRPPTPWLVIVFDGVNIALELEKLTKFPWSKYSIATILSTPTEAWRTVQPEMECPYSNYDVDGFSKTDVKNYLKHRLGDKSEMDVPEHILPLLKRPLLAEVVCKIAEDDIRKSLDFPSNDPKTPKWSTDFEYILLERYWKKLSTSAQGALATLARDALERDVYPWNPGILAKHNLASDTLTTAVATGWLHRLYPEQYVIWHDRLLSWVIAKGLQYAIQNSDDITNLLQKAQRQKAIRGRSIPHVQSDLAWLLDSDKRRVAVPSFGPPSIDLPPGSM